MPTTIVEPLPNGTPIVLVDREQMRFPADKKKLAYTDDIQGFISQPTPPPVFDYSKGETIKFPILGNDQAGDCYYAAILHQIQAWLGCQGKPVSFDVSTVLARYRRLSGGDNGLGDSQVVPEMKNGVIGPNGPHKIIDDIQVDPTDDAAVAQAMWLCGGLLWTCSLLPNWMPSRTHAGSHWTNDGRPNPRAGHAMFLTGTNAAGDYDVRTWGLSPCVTLTKPGLKAGDSELLACASKEQFDDLGFHVSGLHYIDVSAAWKSMGFKNIPDNTYPVPDAGLLTYLY